MPLLQNHDSEHVVLIYLKPSHQLLHPSEMQSHAVLTLGYSQPL